MEGTAKKQRRKLLFGFILFGVLPAMLLFATAGIAFAQGDPTTASLRGVITDSSGAQVVQATVTLKSAEKGVTRHFTTNTDGGYSFQQLPSSTYVLSVDAKGFKGYTQKGITLNPGQSASQDVVLSIGSQQEQVEVTAEAPLLNTQDANVSADIEAKQLVELPLDLRNVFGLVTLNSSVSTTSVSQGLLGGGGGAENGGADQGAAFFNFGGGFFGTSAFLLDGIWDTSSDWGANVYTPSVDAVQEFKIQNNSFTAQYGWSTGNVINVVTKSGTNKFHGSAYEFYRNSAMDANFYFANLNGQPKAAFTRNQTGASAGGPIYIPGLYKQTDKTFIFGLYEHQVAGSPILGTFSVPTTKMLGGDFSELLGTTVVGTDYLGRSIYSGQVYDPYSGREVTNGQADPVTGLTATLPAGQTTAYIRDPIPGNDVAHYGNLPGGALNTIAQKFLSYYPASKNSALSNNLVLSATEPLGSDEYLVRVDHNLGSSSRIFGRYSYKSEFKVQAPEYWGPDNPAGPGNTRPNNRYNITAGASHVFTPTLTMNAVAGFGHWGEGSHNQSLGFKPSSLGLPTLLDAASAEFPLINIGPESTLGPTGGAENTAYRPTGSASVDFIKVSGRHELSFGFMGVESQHNSSTVYITTLNFGGAFTNGPDPDSPAANTGNGVVQALFGVLDSNGGNTGVAFDPAISKRYGGIYLQDNWKISRKLSVNLGARYEFQQAPTYRHDTSEYFDPDLVNPVGTGLAAGSFGQALKGTVQFVGPDHRGTYDTNWLNLAPRGGFTYSVTPKIVVRAGYGIFYPPSAYLSNNSTDGFSTSTSIVGEVSGARVPNPAVSLSNPWPQGLRKVTGNTLGGLEDVGYSIGADFKNRPSAYVAQYMLGVQYAFTTNDVLDLSYIGNHGIHMLASGLNEDQLDPKYLSMGTAALNSPVPNPFYGTITGSGCSLDQPQVAAYQLLLPYPQFCGVTQSDAQVGTSDYNSLQATFNHRFSQGLNVLVSYTFSKFLDNVEGEAGWSYVANSGPANNYNLAAEKSVDSGDIPQALVVNYIYQLPVGKGKKYGSTFNRKTDAVLGGWEVTGISTFKNGVPVGVTGSNINSFGGNPRPDVVGSLNVANRSIKEWFNTGAFAYAAYGTFGTAPRAFSNLRGPGYQDWDIAIQKNWIFPKETRLQFRAEMFNVFNHANFYNPNQNYSGCDPNASTSCNSTFGKITASYPPRDIQIAAKFYW